MQAVIALCHFCESHGPRVLVTCQPMRNPPLVESSCRVDTDTSSLDTLPGSSSVPMSPEGLPIFYGDCRNTVFDTEDRCSACTSYGDGPCLLTNDHVTKTSYVSSQVALSEPVYERVKYSCLRSVSCEVSAPPPMKSPMKTVASMSAPQRIPCVCSPSTSTSVGGGVPEDIEAEMRRAIEADGHVFFGDTEHGYTLSLTFRLQDTKARGFLRLFSLIVVTNDMTYLLNNHDFFLAALTTIKDKMQALASARFSSGMSALDDALRPENASRIARLPQGLFTRKIALDTQRTLQTITGEDNIWNRLHRQMMWTLRTQTMRTGESILEGVPTQDMMVIMEMNEMDIIELELDSPNVQEMTMIQLENLKIIARTLAENGCDEDLDLLVKQVICGGQVVVECDSRLLAKQFLLALSNLLPIGCIKMLNWTEIFQHGLMNNLLGCPLDVDIPLDMDDVLVIRVLSSGRSIGPSLDGSSIQMRRRPARAFRHVRPALVTRYKQLMLDPDVQDTVLDATIRGAREQWVAKAKLMYQLMKQSTRLEERKAIQVVKATMNDRDVLMFWQAGLSKAYKAHVIETINHQIQQQRNVHQ